jgi:hypothetical protein
LVQKLNDFLTTLDPDKLFFFSPTQETVFESSFLETTIEQIHQEHPDVKYLPIIKEENVKVTRLAVDTLVNRTPVNRFNNLSIFKR